MKWLEMGIIAVAVFGATSGCGGVTRDSEPGKETGELGCRVQARHQLQQVDGGCFFAPSLASVGDEVRSLWGISYPETCFEDRLEAGEWRRHASISKCREPQLLHADGGWLVAQRNRCDQVVLDGSTLALPACMLKGAGGHYLQSGGGLTRFGVHGSPFHDGPPSLHVGLLKNGEVSLESLDTAPGEPADFAVTPAGQAVFWFTDQNHTRVMLPDGAIESLELESYPKGALIDASGRIHFVAEHRSDHGHYTLSTRDPSPGLSAAERWSTVALPEPTGHYGSCPKSAGLDELCEFDAVRYESPTLVRGTDHGWLVAVRSQRSGRARWGEVPNAAPPPNNISYGWSDEDVQLTRTLELARLDGSALRFEEVDKSELESHGTLGAVQTAAGVLHVQVNRTSTYPETCAPIVLEVTCDSTPPR